MADTNFRSTGSVLECEEAGLNSVKKVRGHTDITIKFNFISSIVLQSVDSRVPHNNITKQNEMNKEVQLGVWL